jgi:DUF2946 family protein
MRQRLRGFIPILLLALMVQILAPIGATWAAAIAVSDPLGAAEICHSDPDSSPPQDDHGGQHLHDGCALCCAAQAGASLDTPQPVSIDTPYRRASIVVWHAHVLTLSAARAGSNTQARAPPLSM